MIELFNEETDAFQIEADTGVPALTLLVGRALRASLSPRLAKRFEEDFAAVVAAGGDLRKAPWHLLNHYLTKKSPAQPVAHSMAVDDFDDKVLLDSEAERVIRGIADPQSVSYHAAKAVALAEGARRLAGERSTRSRDCIREAAAHIEVAVTERRKTAGVATMFIKLLEAAPKGQSHEQ